MSTQKFPNHKIQSSTSSHAPVTRTQVQSTEPESLLPVHALPRSFPSPLPIPTSPEAALMVTSDPVGYFYFF